MWIEVKTYQCSDGRWSYTFRDADNKLHGDIGFMSKDSAYQAGWNRVVHPDQDSPKNNA